LALAWVLSRGRHIVPIAGTSHTRYLEENAATAALRLSPDTEEVLAHMFRPGAAAGDRYPAAHLARLGI
jgi:aryl-alcohol dehydrogenase-like predicted oxidoreductase